MSQAGSARAQGDGARAAEARALRRYAEATHPRGREAAADPEWRRRWDGLIAEADTLSDGRYFLRTRAALGWFKDGHTTPLPFEYTGGAPEAMARGPFGLSLPMRVRAFHDGAYVVAAKDEALPLLGARITHVGDLDAVAFMNAWARDWPGNDAWAHRWSGVGFASPALLEALGAVRDPAAPIIVRAQAGGRRVRATLRPRAGASGDLQDVPRALTQQEQWAEAAGFGNYARPLPDRGALYISCDDMANLEGKSFEAFTRECLAAMAQGSAERLVLDLRRNGGGNNFLQEPLRKEILRSRFNRPGGLFVLIGPVTFSAAQNPATRLERDSFAVFVGEPSGGTPNHYGDAETFTGEATGIVSIVSTIPWFDSYPMDDRPWILPDAPAPSLFDDWRAGRDAGLEAALSYASDRPLDAWIEERIFYFRRESQQAGWRPFWRH